MKVNTKNIVNGLAWALMFLAAMNFYAKYSFPLKRRVCDVGQINLLYR
jgi:hypothetical protein